MHEDDPFEELYFPVPQSVQPDAPAAEYAPAVHTSGVVVFTEEHLKPEGHSLHELAPVSLYDPSPHSN